MGSKQITKLSASGKRRVRPSMLTVFFWAVIFSLLLFGAKLSLAACKADIFNPITDICWQCIFPIRMGGIDVVGSDIDSPPDDVAMASVSVARLLVSPPPSGSRPASSRRSRTRIAST